MTTTATASIAVTTGILTASSISAGGVIQPGAQVTGPGIGGSGLALTIAQAINVAGTGYDASGSGTFTGVPVTGGSGSGALATVTVVSGNINAVASILITTAGSGYIAGDVLGLQASSVGAGGVTTPVQFLAPLAAPNPTPVIIQPYGTAGTTGTGGNGTYATNIVTAVSSATMTFSLTEPPVGTPYLQGVPSPVPAWNSATPYVAQNLPLGVEGNVVAVSGLFYLCILANTNHTPPNATYWQLLPESLPEVYTAGPPNSLAHSVVLPLGLSVIPPAPLPSGVANTAIGIAI
jgi:hypothetical protein